MSYQSKWDRTVFFTRLTSMSFRSLCHHEQPTHGLTPKPSDVPQTFNNVFSRSKANFPNFSPASPKLRPGQLQGDGGE